MIQEKIRKEVTLDKNIIEKLTIKAKEDGRNLKNYLEKILIDKANDDFLITEDYKKMMDEILEKKANGQLNFVSEEDFKSRIIRRR